MKVFRGNKYNIYPYCSKCKGKCYLKTLCENCDETEGLQMQIKNPIEHLR